MGSDLRVQTMTKEQTEALIDEKEADQFAPFLDEIIDTNDLEPVSPGSSNVSPSEPNRQWMTIGDMGTSKHIFQEMSIVKSRIGFDEQEFREQCQRVQTMLTSEFKGTRGDGCDWEMIPARNSGQVV